MKKWIGRAVSWVVKSIANVVLFLLAGLFLTLILVIPMAVFSFIVVKLRQYWQFSLLFALVGGFLIVLLKPKQTVEVLRDIISYSLNSIKQFLILIVVVVPIAFLLWAFGALLAGGFELALSNISDWLNVNKGVVAGALLALIVLCTIINGIVEYRREKRKS